ncbi:hypothetical protein FB451DRAFT_1570201 [Mycena latifolia]|nr:hypothetical protein FB451DRAFT_1570201 [Mycena latifolia]
MSEANPKAEKSDDAPPFPAFPARPHLFAFGACAASASIHFQPSAAASSSASASAIGTPTNSAALPSLSGLSSCAANCLGLAAAATNCSSEVAFNCFCVAPNAKPYAKALVSCLTACPTEVASTEALVEQFCAAATKPTPLSFPSFVPSSTSASASASSASGSSTAASTTAPASSSPPPSTTSNATLSAHPFGMGVGVGVGMGGVAATLLRLSHAFRISIRYAVFVLDVVSILSTVSFRFPPTPHTASTPLRFGSPPRYDDYKKRGSERHAPRRLISQVGHFIFVRLLRIVIVWIHLAHAHLLNA